MLTNALAPLVVRMTYVFAIAILVEAVLSFIGVGPPPPTPTFGGIIANGRDFIVTAPWITIFPGLAIVIWCSASTCWATACATCSTRA